MSAAGNELRLGSGGNASDHRDSHREPPLGTLFSVVLDRLTRGEGPKPIAGDRRVVHEHLLPVVRDEESVALGVVEEFDDGARHVVRFAGYAPGLTCASSACASSACASAVYRRRRRDGRRTDAPVELELRDRDQRENLELELGVLPGRASACWSRCGLELGAASSSKRSTSPDAPARCALKLERLLVERADRVVVRA